MRSCSLLIILALATYGASAGQSHRNELGMEFLPIPAGEFMM